MTPQLWYSLSWMSWRWDRHDIPKRRQQSLNLRPITSQKSEGLTLRRKSGISQYDVAIFLLHNLDQMNVAQITACVDRPNKTCLSHGRSSSTGIVGVTGFNLLKTKLICFYTRTLCVPRSKHFPPRL